VSSDDLDLQVMREGQAVGTLLGLAVGEELTHAENVITKVGESELLVQHKNGIALYVSTTTRLLNRYSSLNVHALIKAHAPKYVHSLIKAKID